MLSGELDMTAAFQLEPELDRLLAAPGVSAVVLDLADVGLVDSTGLGALLSVKERATRFDIEFTIGRASASVQRILDLTGTRSMLGG